MLSMLSTLSLLSLLVHAVGFFSGAPRAPRAASPRCCAPLDDGTWEIGQHGEGTALASSSLRVAVAGKELRFESGVMARQASGAVTVTQGDTHVFCAACFEKKDALEPIDFTPLRVDYFERKSAVGKTAGGFIKRDGRPSDHETLTARIIDRPIRPLIAEGWSLETQLTACAPRGAISARSPCDLRAISVRSPSDLRVISARSPQACSICRSTRSRWA